MILSANVNNFADLVKKDVTIITFLQHGITEEEIKEVESALKKVDNVDTITFRDKMENQQNMMNDKEAFRDIMKDWTESETSIQDTFLVKVKNVDKIKETAEKIKTLDHVQAAYYGEELVENMLDIFDAVKNISYGTFAALVIVTAFLISNTIKITIFSRKREIEIMRLVGASNINIKIPFIFEGLFLGILGSIIPIIFTTYGYSALYTKIGGKFISQLFKLIEPEPFIFYVSGILVAIGMVVGMLGSYRAVRKYLKV
jgi:cell division transport system permease protein